MLKKRYVDKIQELERLFGGPVRAVGFLNCGMPFIRG